MSKWSRFAGTSALATLALALAAPVAVYAQETTGAITGQIASGGSAVANATVVITHLPSGSRGTTRTDGAGQFSVSGLRAGGPYSVEVTADGFKGARVNDVYLNVTQPFALALNLDAAAEREVETVIVTASAVGRGRVDGSATGLRRDQIEAVATPGRDIRELARQSPLVTQNTVGDGGISIAGSNPRTNRITIDGVAAQDDFGLNTGGLPTRRGPISLDAVSQFNITPAPFDVRNGGFLGGAIDIVLRSGDNEFGGSVFGNFLADDLTGTQIGNTKVSNKVEQTNYGATLRGPILKDKLFFALSYEKYESADTTPRGPAGGIFLNTLVGPTGAPMTQAEIDAVTNVFKNTYGSDFAFGSIPTNKPILDEKYSLRLDWNISDKHRAQFTYRNAESTVFNFTNLAATTASLDSQWYFTGEKDTTMSLQLNSDWNDRFQTEARVSYRDYERLQEPPSGQTFSDISVCSTPKALDATGSQPLTTCASATGVTRGVVRFGPDQFRHANYLATTNTQGQFEARYRLADHLIKGGLQWQEREIYNLFVPNSDGTYYFDSIEDFAAGKANRLQYSNHPSGDA
ncbi:MAG: hypothetical protein RL186_408, partial [Pseudomonadota bacterium]